MRRLVALLLATAPLGACGLDPELWEPQPEGPAIAAALWREGTPQAQVDNMVLRVVDLGDGRRAAVRTGGVWYEAEPAFVQRAAQAVEQMGGCTAGATRVLSPVAVAVDCGTASAPPAGS